MARAKRENASSPVTSYRIILNRIQGNKYHSDQFCNYQPAQFFQACRTHATRKRVRADRRGGVEISSLCKVVTKRVHIVQISAPARRLKLRRRFAGEFSLVNRRLLFLCFHDAPRNEIAEVYLKFWFSGIWFSRWEYNIPAKSNADARGISMEYLVPWVWDLCGWSVWILCLENTCVWFSTECWGFVGNFIVVEWY